MSVAGTVCAMPFLLPLLSLCCLLALPLSGTCICFVLPLSCLCSTPLPHSTMCQFQDSLADDLYRAPASLVPIILFLTPDPNGPYTNDAAINNHLLNTPSLLPPLSSFSNNFYFPDHSKYTKPSHFILIKLRRVSTCHFKYTLPLHLYRISMHKISDLNNKIKSNQ